jgi:malonyl-CoA/methylmalonyl-CoA synthetase
VSGENHLLAALQSGHAQRMNETFIHGQAGQDITYGQFWINAARMATSLVALGVSPGDRVAIQATKHVAMLELYGAAIISGAILLPLNTSYTNAEISYFLNDARPKIFVCDAQSEASLVDVAYDCGVETVLVLTGSGENSLEWLRDAHTAGLTPVPRGAEDIAAILYTSGTTGRAKGAMLSHRALASNAAALVALWQFSNDDRLIHALPIFHTHGLFVAINVAMMAGASLDFLAGFDAEAIIGLMPKASVLMGVPTFYTRMLNDPALPDAARAMRLFVSGSAPLLAETHRQWEMQTGHRILERYGMTETNMNTSNPYDQERRPGTVGFALPGVEVRIVDSDTGLEVPDGEVGGIEVRGANLFSGYWENPVKTAADMCADGFFKTGDLARRDDEGYIHIVGRAKDLIISGGLNIYPTELELIIDAFPGVEESAVFGITHPDFGESAVAAIVPDKGATVELGALREFLAGQLARFKQPREIVIVDALPRNSMGKVQKNVLAASYGDLIEVNRHH